MQIMTQGQQTTATAGSTSTAASAAPAVSASPATASAEMAGDVAQVNVVHQVAQGVTGQAGLGRQVVVQLDPPELGSVRVTFQEDGQGLRGVLEVQHADTANQLQRETTELMNRLAAEGIQVRRLDVVVEPQSTGNSPSGSQTQSDTPGGRDASTGAQDFSSSSSDSQDRSGSSHESTGRSTSAPVADGSQDASDESLSPAASGQDGINLWM
jgi:flagellar hook-length control protein FliK